MSGKGQEEEKECYHFTSPFDKGHRKTIYFAESPFITDPLNICLEQEKKNSQVLV